MEQGNGAVIILVGEGGDIHRINAIISEHANMIPGRQGIPLRDRSTHWQTGKASRGKC